MQEGHRQDKVASLIDRWLARGARLEQVAIVTIAGQTKSRFVKAGAVGRHRVVSADDDERPTAVVADTFLRFKGFERPLVVVTELGGEDERPEYDVRMYIALTRATVEVVVVATADEIASDPRLGDLPRRA